MTVSFVCRTESVLPAEQLFDRARSIDAHVETMAASGERAVAGVTAGLIGAGEEVTWRGRHFGVPLTMTSRVTRFDYPASFVDEQVRGPFKAFRHVHEFAATEAGSVMTDRIEFTAPFGPVGWLVERVILRRYLARLIAGRGALFAMPCPDPGSGLHSRLEAGFRPPHPNS